MISTVTRRRLSVKQPADALNEIDQTTASAAVINLQPDPALSSAAGRPTNSMPGGDLLANQAAPAQLDPNGDLERPWVLQP